MSKLTKNALLACGVDSALADRLIRTKHTIKSLSMMRKVELLALDLAQENIEYIQKKRPPIPKENLIKLLYQLRGTCCFCRGSKSKSFVIHHIRPWSESRSHEIDNLILLCPECHNQAHAKYELTQNITPETLLKLKNEWIEFIQEDDKKIIRMCKEKESAFDLKAWDYFNHNRILDFLPNHHSLSEYAAFFEAGQSKMYLYAGVLRTTSTYYQFTNLISQLLGIKNYVFVDNQTSIGDLSVLVNKDMFVVLTANHRFKKFHKWSATGPGQRRIGYYKRKGLEINFHFDSWECTSTSAQGNLSGNWLCTSLLWVRNIQKEKEAIKIDATCLAIGTNIVPHTPITPEFVAKRKYEEMPNEYGEEDLLKMDDDSAEQAVL